MDKTASDKLRVLSFFFTIIIVVYHSNIIVEQMYTSNSVRILTRNTWEYLANVAMSFFFMVTGFLLYNGASRENICRKLQSRVKTIVVPFLVWNSIYWAMSMLQHRHIDDIWHIFYRFSFDPYDGPLWYLFAITILSLVAPVVLRIKTKKLFRIVVFVICLISVWVYSFHLLTAVSKLHIMGWIERLCRYLPSYIIGSYIGINVADCGKASGNVTRKISGIILAVFSIMWISAGNHLPDLIKNITLLMMPIMVWKSLPKKMASYQWMRNSFIKILRGYP